ncbi:ATP-binding cassette domain-containing protein [Moorella naiadis]|uniref:ATP-binding cassette domain-containing protein n=1 Tax=Moorella naiadis (nom. illeg.) TaxID=3093670 RepID=UPI003D9C92D8
MEAKQVIKATNIKKYFGSVRALEGANIEVYPGEVVGLLGDNGAGKSTLVNILSGVYRPDGGELYLDGQKVEFDNPLEARKRGIETVYQELALAPHLDIVTNIFLGREEIRPDLWGRLGFLDRKSMREKALQDLDKLRITIKSVEQRINQLSGGQRQAVAVARAVSWGTKLIIMDEPTAALGVEESLKVLELIKEIKNHRIPIILITHTIPYAFKVCDRLVIMRLGRTIANLKISETTIDDVIAWITGSKISA